VSSFEPQGYHSFGVFVSASSSGPYAVRSRFSRFRGSSAAQSQTSHPRQQIPFPPPPPFFYDLKSLFRPTKTRFSHVQFSPLLRVRSPFLLSPPPPKRISHFRRTACARAFFSWGRIRVSCLSPPPFDRIEMPYSVSFQWSSYPPPGHSASRFFFFSHRAYIFGSIGFFLALETATAFANGPRDWAAAQSPCDLRWPYPLSSFLRAGNFMDL